MDGVSYENPWLLERGEEVEEGEGRQPKSLLFIKISRVLPKKRSCLHAQSGIRFICALKCQRDGADDDDGDTASKRTITKLSQVQRVELFCFAITI